MLFAATLVATFAVAACTSADTTPPDDDARAAAGGSSGAGAGMPGVSGSSDRAGSGGGGTLAGGSGGAPTGGMAGNGQAGQSQSAGTGGSMPTNGGQAGATLGGAGGIAAGGMSGGVASAGATSAGRGGRSAGGMSGGGAGGMPATDKAPPKPSTGCGKANPQAGSSSSPLNVSSHQYYVKLPTGYDANKPYPVFFMFNPTNNPLNWAEQNAGFESNAAKDAWIRVYPGPANMASGWGAGDVAFFEPLYAAITGNFCVDQARVFAGGESSGGDFVSILGCEHADKLRATAPCATKDVSGYPLDATKRKCTAQVTAVVIHGKNDNVVGPENGPLTRDFYRALNHCTNMSTPVDGYTDTKSNCVLFQGCDDGYPVYWCQHTDPEYSNTNHGWPHFAAGFLWSLFSSY